MAFAARTAENSPMGDLNTTPLIDVLLVLLVMFIITIPVATHTVDIDLPGTPPTILPAPDIIKNKIVISGADELLWNGTAIDEEQLNALLYETRMMPVEPELQFEPEANASYYAAARILKLIKSSQVTKFGFVGNDRFRSLEGA
ncbi:biopolymer transporter ExbD [Pontixanthobacter gangjinensis]|uniref:Biopolymer transporter ExbD n=1 Tax=Pontixanthobacter gangjinensis TaxID=1028742 RepID=A0A6I4SL81_9SPHN|nr:biopolymer transporter ExbD [Pontixanthobacter gangjinensis]MXO55557.1 biopolymer transporter ExbD [Pontixanthobacter gangjinensis]